MEWFNKFKKFLNKIKKFLDKVCYKFYNLLNFFSKSETFYFIVSVFNSLIKLMYAPLVFFTGFLIIICSFIVFLLTVFINILFFFFRQFYKFCNFLKNFNKHEALDFINNIPANLSKLIDKLTARLIEFLSIVVVFIGFLLGAIIAFLLFLFFRSLTLFNKIRLKWSSLKNAVKNNKFIKKYSPCFLTLASIFSYRKSFKSFNKNSIFTFINNMKSSIRKLINNLGSRGVLFLLILFFYINFLLMMFIGFPIILFVKLCLFFSKVLLECLNLKNGVKNNKFIKTCKFYFFILVLIFSSIKSFKFFNKSNIFDFIDKVRFNIKKLVSNFSNQVIHFLFILFVYINFLLITFISLSKILFIRLCLLFSKNSLKCLNLKNVTKNNKFIKICKPCLSVLISLFSYIELSKSFIFTENVRKNFIKFLNRGFKFFNCILNLLSTMDHKKIGLCYIFFGIFCGFIGFFMSMFIRVEVSFPGNSVLSGSCDTYNSLVTSHGILMLFFASMPIFIGGVGNYMIPLMIGCRDLAFPKLNNVSFFLLVFSFIFFMFSNGILGYSIDPFSGGWTMYPPLSMQENNVSTAFLIISLHLNGISSLINAINMIVTIVNYSSLSKWHCRPFVWSILIVSYLLILVLPVLVSALTMLITDKFLGTCFFSVTAGGDPVLFQHIFWFFGHPEVYILILPVFGLVSEFISEYSGGRLLGKKVMIWSMIGIGFLGCVVWGHHMYTVGMDVDSKMYFALATTIISIPTGLKVVMWMCNFNAKSIKINDTILCCIFFIISFVIGGFTGLVLAQPGFDLLLHDTYFIVAHFHYVLGVSLVYMFFAFVYNWYYFFTGVMHNSICAKIHLITFFVGSNLTFMPMHFLGISGLSRRVFDYPSCFTFWNQISSIGSFITFMSLIWFFIAISPIFHKLIKDFKLEKQDSRKKIKRIAKIEKIYKNKPFRMFLRRYSPNPSLYLSGCDSLKGLTVWLTFLLWYIVLLDFIWIVIIFLVYVF